MKRVILVIAGLLLISSVGCCQEAKQPLQPAIKSANMAADVKDIPYINEIKIIDSETIRISSDRFMEHVNAGGEWDNSGYHIDVVSGKLVRNENVEYPKELILKKDEGVNIRLHSDIFSLTFLGIRDGKTYFHFLYKTDKGIDRDEDIAVFPYCKAPIVIKLQLSQTNNMMNLSIALSFTGQSEKPVYEGVRIVSEDISFYDKKTIFGFRNGDGVTHIKLPTQNVTIENETYSYVKAEMDRQENGMFRLSRVPSDSSGNTYHLRGVFYAQGHLFVINEIVNFNEEEACYETKAN